MPLCFQYSQNLPSSIRKYVPRGTKSTQKKKNHIYLYMIGLHASLVEKCQKVCLIKKSTTQALSCFISPVGEKTLL